MGAGPSPVGLSTISRLLQRSFSGQGKDRRMNAPRVNSPTRTAVNTGGTAVAVAAVPLPERRSHEAQQQLELGLVPSDGRGGASAPSLDRPIRWLV